MTINKITKKISDFPVSAEILEHLESLSNWENPRNSFYGLTEAGSVLLKYNMDSPEGMVSKIYSNHEKLLTLMMPAILHVQGMFSPSYCSRAVIANLPPKKEIKAHIDPGWPFYIQRRFCWVLRTNEKAFFEFGDIKANFKQGEIWEINNKEIHSAANNGDSDRIHLIFDLAIVDEILAVTPTPFVPGSFDDKFFNIVLKKKNKKINFDI